MDRDKLSAVCRERFPELLRDCGETAQPGIADIDGFRDWSDLETTSDQLRIEEYLDRAGLERKAILHVGIGNSGFARRFVRRASRVVGITIAPGEAQTAANLGLSNYTAILHNKYSDANGGAVPGQFDLIIDNNLTGYCCCAKHLGNMLEFYASKLSAGGQLITDRRGLAWTTEDPRANSRWRFSFDDLAAVAACAGLNAYRATADIFILAQTPPSPPTLGSRLAYLFRKLRRSLSRFAGRSGGQFR